MTLWVADRAHPDNEPFFRACAGLDFGLQAVKADSGFDFGFQTTMKAVPFPLGKADGVWIRLDHPVPDDFLSSLRTFFTEKPIVNDPQGLIRTASKAHLIEIAQALPGMAPYLTPMKLCHTADDIVLFRDTHPDMVLKGLRGYGGKDVVRFRQPPHKTDIYTLEEAEIFMKARDGVLAVPYLDPPGGQSDKRIVVCDGVTLGAVSRMPREGDWRAKISIGASVQSAVPTPAEQDMVFLLDPWLRAMGIFLYGIDTLADNEDGRVLSEVNTLNVGMIRFIETHTGRPVIRDCAFLLARRLLGA
ncbi:MAG: hypothetical protein KDJ15_07650 [Alphaproteobacteria bacterium]|nr:hypothetical protein [Alphaproteobacteria bacterium]